MDYLEASSKLNKKQRKDILNIIAQDRIDEYGAAGKAANLGDRAFSILGGSGNNIRLNPTEEERFISLARGVLKPKRKGRADGGNILEDDRAMYKDGGEGIKSLKKVAPEVVERMGYSEGGYNLQEEFKKSKNAFIEKMAKAQIKDVKNKKDRDEFIRLSIGDREKVAKQLGIEENLQSDIKAKVREIAEDENPLLKTRQVRAGGGEIDNQMKMIMETPMQEDEAMEDNYTRFIMEEALSEDEEDMLTSKLEQDEQLSMLFDKIIDVAQEFAGSGPVEGPGSGVSDSIPARLSDGEFVFTAKAVEEIGADNLMSMMKDAEASADERQQAYGGGVMGDQLEKVVQTETRITKPADAMSPALGAKEDNMIQEEVTRNMLDPRVPHVRS